MKHVTSYIFLIIAFLLLGVNGVAAQKEDCPFKVTDRSNANISYDKENKVLSIEGSDKVTIEGDGTSTGWGIEIESQSIHFQVTIKDLSIEREGVPLKIKGVFNCSITIEGTNRFVSTGSSGTAGIEVKGPLSLRGSGSLTAIGAKGDDITPGGAGIGGGAYLNIYGGIIHAKGGVGAAGIGGGGGYLTIDGGIIRAEGGAGAPGIGVSDPQEGMTIQIFGGTVTAIGSGGKNPAPGIYGGTSSDYTTIAGNAFIIAIDREDANEVIATTTQIENHTKGLFIRGEQDSDGSIVWASSDLKGDITLESDAEIPDWAEVTIADGQTFTIADGITLTNNGVLTNKGTLTNNGTFSGLGTVESNTSLNIGGEDGFDVINTDGGATFSYNGTEKLLTISGSDRVLIKGRNKDKAVGCGIVIAQGASPTLTIEDLNIEAAEALVYRGRSDGILLQYNLTLQGTNRLTSTSGGGINLNDNNITFAGSGSLTVTGGNGCAGIQGLESLSINENVFVVAIDGKGATSGISGSLQHDSGLLIYGSQDDTGNFSQEYSKLIGSDFTLGGDAEIPKGATVTIAAGQTFTIAPGVTLTNNGTLENNGALTNEGTLTNNGTLSGTGTVESNTSLNIGGKDGFDVSNTGGGVTFSYNGKEKLLTISGTIGDVLIKGRNKDNAVGCGIVIAQYASFYLTIEDLNIVTDEALVFRGTSDGQLANYNLTLQGTNRLTSTSGAGINLNGNNITFAGSGSLTVTGGNGCAGIQGLESLSIYKNAFVVVIGGKDAASGISGNLHHDSGFLIYGSQDDTSNFSQEYSKLEGSDFTLGGDAEIPKGAEVIIADNQTFTIDAGVTLTNSGTIDNEGTINNEGIIYNKGTLTGNPVKGHFPYHYITFDANYPASPAVDERYILQGETLPSDIFTRSGYTFQGWYDAPSGETKVETSAEPQTLYARWEAVPVPEPEPTVYYTVTLPFVEGAVTDPVAGDYDVESGSTFRFYLTLDMVYSQSQPIVTTSRGETLTPRTSDGAYLLKYVCTDVEVYIDGIEKNNPVANEPIRAAAPEPEIWSEDACLCIRLSEGLPTSPVRIFTPEGRLLDSFRSTPGLNRRQLPTGIYIVQVGKTARKVAVK